MLPNLATTYESSLTLLALLSQPEPTADQLRQARLVADTLVYALQHDHAAGVSGVGIPPVTSGGGDCTTATSRTISGCITASRAAGAGPGAAGRFQRQQHAVCGGCRQPPPTFCLVQDGATGGNNAFAMMALLAAYRQFRGDPAGPAADYLAAAREIGHWIVDGLRDEAGYGGYFFGYDEGAQLPRK